VKITIEHEGSIISVEQETATLDEVVEHLIEPALVAIGFDHSQVVAALGGEEKEGDFKEKGEDKPGNAFVYEETEIKQILWGCENENDN